MTIENLLEEIETILDEGKSVPFTSNLLVDAQAIKTAIEDIRLNILSRNTKFPSFRLKKSSS